MHRRHWLLLIFLSTLAGAIAAALLAPHVIRHPPRASHPPFHSSARTALTITRIPSDVQVSVDTTPLAASHDAAVRILNDLNSLEGLEKLPSNTIDLESCPNESDPSDDDAYALRFTSPSVSAQTDARICRHLTIDSDTYIATDQLWHDIDEAVIYATQTQSTY